MALNLAQCFDGKIDDRSYSQIAELNTYYTDSGVSRTFHRELVTRKSREQVFTFTGVPNSVIKTLPSSITVTDLDGTSYIIPLVSSVTDGSSGTKVFETESVNVQRRRLSYHMWELTVARVGSEYWADVDGSTVKIINGPAWMSL